VLRRTLNLGILAHVDAGKTTLTERLLFAAGVIDEVGSVDDGTTQTDFLALERQRGITIRSAVVTFAIGDVAVNLIDTPGHPDFIAEVDRVLDVLDGAVLVVSAVEGVQPQTRILMRALARLRIPSLLFVNKIDRAGADEERVLGAISERLTTAAVPMGVVRLPGTRGAAFTPFAASDPRFRSLLAEALAERDETILASYVDGDGLSDARLRHELASQTGRALVHPVFFGSALTGAGVEPLMAGIAELLPSGSGDPDAPASGTIFKIERAPSGEKVAYVRLREGTIRTRDRMQLGSGLEGKVTAIGSFDGGRTVHRSSVTAGEVATLRGLAAARVGDRIGAAAPAAADRRFPPPTLESVVVPREPDDAPRLRLALEQLAEQDPLIDVRRTDAGEVSVSLYGEVQKEVLEAILASD
jgi:ribosomal protection tetracycline resistance protein